jgi:prepilin-type N-terminal cleavage/methylation domain-containing protein
MRKSIFTNIVSRFEHKITSGQKSFTIVELVMVIVLIGIIASVTLVSMPDMESIRIAQAANKIKSDIRFAQRLAMQLQRRTAILFVAASDSYSIAIENTYGAANWDFTNVKAKDPLTQQDFDVQLNSGDFQGVDITTVLFNSANYALMFDRNGDPYSLQPGAPFTAAALSEPAEIILNTNRKYILVKQGTGRVNVQDAYP